MTTTTTAARPPFDPELEPILTVMQEQPFELTRETIPLLRQAPTPVPVTDEMLAGLGLVRRDITIPGYDGHEMPASVIARADHTGTGPAIYYIHGGGMITGTRLEGTHVALPWLVEHDAVLVTADYRLAPEFPDPYPIEDAYAGLVWTAENAADLGIDADRILAMGPSAGGGLTAGLVLLARDRRGPELIGQLLICPMLDDRDATVSTRQYDAAAGGTWVREYNQVAWDALLGERRGGPDVSIYAAPARATDLSGLPQTFIDTGSAEVFRDEDVSYATALWAAGVQTELHVWAGGFHGFDFIAPHTAVGQAALEARDNWVARILGS